MRRLYGKKDAVAKAQNSRIIGRFPNSSFSMKEPEFGSNAVSPFSDAELSM
jgi:hypothetical protein